ncbi:MAG: transporter substrate-binding protein [Bacillota bacterium]|jgi:zinc transport system substrate-binding protein|nr:transporter substrate-binding protein [Bacillota bacterium]
MEVIYMKRFAAAVAAVLLVLFAITGCGRGTEQKNSDQNSENKRISVVTTIFPPYDFTRQIADDKADITMLLPPGGESHSFEPTPQDIIKIQNCDLFIYVGGENDQWVRKILDSVDTSSMKVLALMDMVSTVEEEVKEGMEDEHDHEQDADSDHEHDGDSDHEHDGDSDHEHDGDSDQEHDGSSDLQQENNAAGSDSNPGIEDADEPEYDEHVWTSPKNAVLITNGILEGLCAADQSNAEQYRSNAAAYIEELNKLDKTFQTLVDSAARKTIVFGDRFPFRYFADEYGLDYWAAFPGCSTETEPSAATVAFLTDKVKEEHIPVIFKIELSNGNIARSISEATGAKVLTLHSCHNLSRSDYENGETYLSLMKKNADALKEALY